MNHHKIFVCVPVLNASRLWNQFSTALRSQGLSPRQVLIIDSESDDDTPQLAVGDGYQLIRIARRDFGHGATRQLAVSFAQDADVLVYLTQDAILANPDALNNLLPAFRNPSVGAAYGRQLPRPGADAIEAHARLFNYPQTSHIRCLSDRERFGFKTIFISNSFAAYRRTALEAVGGFPANTIFGEDTITAARLLLAGWDIAYVADAPVYHSHSYTVTQDLRRYFDIGVLHSRESWLIKEFGGAGGEGRRFITSELQFLWRNQKPQIPSALLRTLAKLAGYRLGRFEHRLSPKMKYRLSMHRSFWKQFT